MATALAAWVKDTLPLLPVGLQAPGTSTLGEFQLPLELQSVQGRSEGAGGGVGWWGGDGGRGQGGGTGWGGDRAWGL